jgi:hypothetical protein
MTKTVRFVVASSLSSVILSGCGGGGAGPIASAPPPVAAPAPTPAPSPAPPPAPPPPAFAAVPATIFREPLYNPQLTVLGKGWQYDYRPNIGGALNLRDTDTLKVSYDAASQTYLVTAPVAGSGTLMQTRAAESYPFPATIPADLSSSAPKNYCCATLAVEAADRPQSRYSYVSLVELYAPALASAEFTTIGYGTFGIAQATSAGEVPTTGTARYSGHVLGHFAGDSGATWIDGKARFDFDFARATLTGDLKVTMQCMMGCLYDPVAYTFANTVVARGADGFSGQLNTPGAPSAGSFIGIFAGPNAAELLSAFQMPFFNGDSRQWMNAGGAIVGKREQGAP